MAELIMRGVLDRLGVVLLLKVRVIVVSAQQSGAVQFFLFILFGHVFDLLLLD